MPSFEKDYPNMPVILMEAGLGERLKREFNLIFDPIVAMAGFVYDEAGKKALITLWTEYIRIAEAYQLPFIATTPTRRANQERVSQSGYSEQIIEDNVNLLLSLREKSTVPMYVGGLMGCKGDAYQSKDHLSSEAAEDFHSWQADLFRRSHADFLYAGIMPEINEATGMAKAMEKTGLPYFISFMVRKDGRLIDGTTIHDAIVTIDKAVQRKPLCYMANCIHPTVLMEALSHPFNQTQTVKERFNGIQANTSPLSPEELDGIADLQASSASTLAKDIDALSTILSLKIIGGCCGTDGSHLSEMAKFMKK